MVDFEKSHSLATVFSLIISDSKETRFRHRQHCEIRGQAPRILTVSKEQVFELPLLIWRRFGSIDQ